jgi:hypothetical protein
MSEHNESEYTLRLTPEQALVLFEWIAQLEEAPALPEAGSAEELVFWRLEAQLQQQIPVLFSERYKDLLQQARRSVVERGPV